MKRTKCLFNGRTACALPKAHQKAGMVMEAIRRNFGRGIAVFLFCVVAQQSRAMDAIVSQTIQGGSVELVADQDYEERLGFEVRPASVELTNSVSAGNAITLQVSNHSSVFFEQDGQGERLADSVLNVDFWLVHRTSGFAVHITTIEIATTRVGNGSINSTVEGSMLATVSDAMVDSRAGGVMATLDDLRLSLKLAAQFGMPELATTSFGGGLLRLVLSPDQAVESSPLSSADDGGVAGSVGPDVIVLDLQSVSTYTPVGDIQAYSIGTISCNIGDTPVGWNADSTDHPVISGGIFRLKDGRFEQIGVSWLKHGFAALTQPYCGNCINPGTIGLLGVDCADTYSAFLNGQQGVLAPRSDVTNVHTVDFVWPRSSPPWSGTIARRIQVNNVDLDPAQNFGAVYFGDGQYISADDAAASNSDNNSSHRKMVFTLNGTGTYVGSMTTPVVVQEPVIRAWKNLEPSVVETDIRVPEEGLFLLSAKASETGTGFWHYEYAVQNLNSERSGRSFRVPIPPDAVITNIGFHDVNYHSGDLFDGTDWTSVIGDGAITWSTVSYFDNPNANALRWGTIYNFRFDSNVAPTDAANVTLGLFRPGLPVSVTVLSVGPSLEIIDCNNNGIADAQDISGGTSEDCDTNQVPDECEPDCNSNSVADPCDLANGTSQDCNANTFPDECEPDCDGDGLPDSCEPILDLDGDGVEDCDDLCPVTTPVGGCLCPEVGECCFDSGFCIDDFPRDFCLELGGIPECLQPPCLNGCLIGDADADGDLDIGDLSGFVACFSGSAEEPGFVPTTPACLLGFNYDGDEDVDLADYVVYAELFSGP